ncbi:MAG: hypothetical protein KA230_08400 [Flavobacteriales bacterium]|nr:hypothetical protein [Flavobacteriales bacterium]
MVTEQLASALGRTDEQPNIALAEAIVAEKNVAGVRELVDLLNGKNKVLKSDALKALYEVGGRAPELIAPFLAQFKNLLTSPDNGMVWGAMCAIDTITAVKPEAVYMMLPQIMAAVDKGSVITRDHAVKALVKLAGEERFAKTTIPLPLEQLRSAPVNQLPMYAELVAPVAKGGAVKDVTEILSLRLQDLPTAAKVKRVEKVLKQLAKG